MRNRTLDLHAIMTIMLSRFAAFFLFFAAISASAQQVSVVVPDSGQPLNRSFVFVDEQSGNVVLLYEKRVVSPTTVALEIRRPDNLKIVKRFTLQMQAKELLRLAEYHPDLGIAAIVQSFPAVHTWVIQPSTGARVRSPLFTLEEAKKLDRTIQRIIPAGLNWNEVQNRWQLLLNLESPSRTISLLASFDATGKRIATPQRIDSGKGQHADLSVNNCRGDLAAATSKTIRLLKSEKTISLEIPEDIAFDPDACRYAVMRKPTGQIPQFILLDADLGVRKTMNLPGGIAAGLIEDTRNQLQYWKDRKSWFYPTVASHKRLYLNEVTPAGLRSRLLETPIDAGSVSVALKNDRIYLLISGLQFGLFERFHRLILVKSEAPE